MPHKNSLVLFSCSTPLLCGVYQEGRLVEGWSYEGKTLDGLVQIAQKYKEVKQIFYARGPGSFTAIKLTHIFLQTLQITQGVELFSTDSFYFNHNAPIKAFGNQYFVKKQEEIVLQKFDTPINGEFELPKILRVEDFSSTNEPLYILPPI